MLHFLLCDILDQMSDNKYRQPPSAQVIKRIDSGISERSKQIYEKMRDAVLRAPEGRPTVERFRPDQFKMGSVVPKFLRFVEKRLESTWLYRSFKLPGTQYVVRDMRNITKLPPDAPNFFKRSEPSLPKNEEFARMKDSPYVNYLGERRFPEAPQKEPIQEISRLLSEFEKLLVERFEKGKTIEQKSEDGKPHFREKTDAEWRDFFSKFLGRTVLRSGDIEALKQIIYRGLAALKKGDSRYAMLVGDLEMTDGQISKFARIKIFKDLVSLVAHIRPGDSIDADKVRELIQTEQFKYLALAHRHEERVKIAKEESRGIFARLKTEEYTADKLGLKRRRGYSGPIKWGGEEEEGAADGHQFIPLGFWERQKRGAWPKIPTITVSILITLLIVFGLMAIVRALI